MTYIAPTDPLDFVLDMNGDSSARVRDLKTQAECASAVMKIENDLAMIRSQIAAHEVDPISRPNGWRTKAQNAMTWKRRVKLAINVHAATLPGAPEPKKSQRSVILRTIKEHIGAERFDELVRIAQAQHPELWEGS